MDLVAFLTAFSYVCSAFGTVLVVCELAQQSYDSFIKIYDMMVQWKWYLLPHDIQRMLPLILNVMQQPVEVRCFGSISCSRETFKRVSSGPQSKLKVIQLTIK